MSIDFQDGSKFCTQGWLVLFCEIKQREFEFSREKKKKKKEAMTIVAVTLVINWWGKFAVV